MIHVTVKAGEEWALRSRDSWEKWFRGFFDQDVVSRGSATFFLAENGGLLVGFCYVVVPKWRIPVGSVGIAVRKDYRRRTRRNKATHERIRDCDKSRRRNNSNRKEMEALSC